MRIVFLRHAAAEERSPGREDFDRRLTGKGISAFEEALPFVKARLGEGEGVLILTSPAARAHETAQMLRKELREARFDSAMWLYTGGDAPFMQMLEGCDTVDCLVLVGHEPLLGEWSSLLCGEPIAYRKGGMAAFEAQGGDRAEPGAWHLLWSRRLKFGGGTVSGPFDPAPPLLKRLKAAGVDAVSQVDHWQERFLEGASRSRPPHQLRVALRDLHSLLSFAGPLFPEDARAACSTALREAAGRFSLLREIDVLQAQRRAFFKDPAQGRRYVAMGRLLQRLRHREEEKCLACLADGTLGQTLQAARILFCALPETGENADEALRLLRKRLKRWRKRITQDLNAFNPMDHRSAHALRVRLKQWNLVRGALPELFPRQGIKGRRLRRLQDELGRLCDTYAHENTIGQLLSGHPSPSLAGEAADFRRELQRLRLALLRRCGQPQVP